MGAGQFLALQPQKLSLMMGQNDYTNTWSLEPIDWKQLKRYREYRGKIYAYNTLLSQTVYIILWGAAAVSFWQRKPATLSIIALLITLFTLASHLILEVQARYHHYLLPFIILAASQEYHEHN